MSTPLEPGSLPPEYYLDYGRSPVSDSPVEAFFSDIDRARPKSNLLLDSTVDFIKLWIEKVKGRETTLSRVISQEEKYLFFTRLFTKCIPYKIDLDMNRHIKLKLDAIDGDIDSFKKYIETSEHFGIILIIKEGCHEYSNMIWFDKGRRLIQRYDPTCRTHTTKVLEDQLLDFMLTSILPDWLYTSGTLEDSKCIPSTNVCGITAESIDYSFLYAIRRMRGHSHHDAALNLVNIQKLVEIEIAQLYKLFAKVSST